MAQASSTKRKSAIPQKRVPSSDSYAHHFDPIPVVDLDFDMQFNTNPGLDNEDVVEKMPKTNKEADIMKITDDDDALAVTGQYIERRIDTFSSNMSSTTSNAVLGQSAESRVDDTIFDRGTGTNEEVVEILANVNNSTVQSASDIPVSQEDGRNDKIENTECGHHYQFITKDEIFEELFSKRSYGNKSPSSDNFSDESSFDCEILFAKVPEVKLQEIHTIDHPDRSKLKAEKQVQQIENLKCQVDEACGTLGLSGTESGSFDRDKSTDEDVKNERSCRSIDENQLIKKMLKKLKKDFQKKKGEVNKVDWAKNSKIIAKEAAEHIELYTLTKSARMKKPPHPTIPEKASTKNDQLKGKITRFQESKKPVIQEVNIITIEAVKPLPKSTHWTPVPHNIRGKDATELINYPNVEPLGLPPAEEKKFKKELFAAYGEKYHGDPLKRSQKLDDDVFLNLVESVVKDTRLKFSKSATPYESEELWTALSKAVDKGRTEAEMKDRYKSMQRKACPPKVTRNLDDASASESVELKQLKDLPVTSYTTLFCRRCFIYDCSKHNESDHLDAKSYGQQKHLISPGKENDGKDREMFSCQDGEKCWRNQNNYVMPEANEIMADWKDSNELSLFRHLWKSFENQHCFIASTLMTKSCQQVHDLAVLLKMESEEDEGFGSSGVTNSNPGPSSGTNNANEVVKYYPNKKFQVPIIPCKHAKDGPCTSKNPNCFCGINGNACEKYCLCPDDCPKRFKGCKCKETCGLDKNCPCFSANRECDPDLCIPCGASKYQPTSPRGCGNVAMLRGYQPNTLEIRESGIHQGGWGLFADSVIKKGEFIVEYRGEIISHDEGERRGLVYDLWQHTFLFTLNQEYDLDAMKFGNEARFINSSKKPNAVGKIMIVNGDQRIGIYAKRDICKGEEISYDYHNVMKKKEEGGHESKG